MVIVTIVQKQQYVYVRVVYRSVFLENIYVCRLTTLSNYLYETVAHATR